MAHTVSQMTNLREAIGSLAFLCFLWWRLELVVLGKALDRRARYLGRGFEVRAFW